MIPFERAASKHMSAGNARQLAELARAAGLGASPDDALEWNRDVIANLTGEEDSMLLADVLRWQGTVLRDRGRTADAEPLYRQSLEMATRLGYDSGIGHALNCLASLAQRRGNIALAANLVTDALLVAERCGDKRLLGMLQQNLGMFADIRGNPAAAQAHYRVSLRIFESTNDQQLVCWILNNLGVLLVKEGEFDEARRSFERAIEISRSRGDLMAEGVLEENCADLELTRGEVDAAWPSIVRAQEVAELRHDNLRLAAALKLKGAHHRLCGRLSESADTLREALRLSASGEDSLLSAEIMYQHGLTLYALGQEQSAREEWTAALDSFERLTARHWIARVRQRLSTGGTGRYL